MTRPYDVVVFGATGFTGELTAQYLAKNAPAELKWALAGRNRAKLEAVRSKLGADVDLLIADVEDAASLKAVAEAARIVVTTVGPYVRYGEPLVAACAEAGTDYLDLTGESEFVDRMYVAYNAKAVETSARIVHCCGFDSIPYDLGVWFTLKHLPTDGPVAVDGFVRAGGKFSAGTYHSALTAFERSTQMSRTARQRRAAEPRPEGRRVRAVPGKVGRRTDLGFWVVPLPTIDPQVVRRSAAARPEYGPDFTYRHFAAVKRLPTVLAGAVGLGAVAGLVKIPPTRRWPAGRRTPDRAPTRRASWRSRRIRGRRRRPR
jgi:saccharopine dehydrogenase (NAD+, L-glutamate forming)